LVSANLYLPIAKEDRKLYTLQPSTVAETLPPTSSAPAMPAPRPLPTARVSGPTRTKRKSQQARMRTGPLPPDLKARVMALTSKKRTVSLTKAEVPELIEATQPMQLTLASCSSSNRPCSQTPEDGSDSTSDTSAPHEPRDLMPPGTSDMSADMEVASAIPTTSGIPCNSVIEVRTISGTGVSVFVQTSSPTLLFVDEDKRPNWLLTSIKEHLQYTPYYLCFSQVVDLFLTQEARLGYPQKVRKH
jgi:hypothetical protein